MHGSKRGTSLTSTSSDPDRNTSLGSSSGDLVEFFPVSFMIFCWGCFNKCVSYHIVTPAGAEKELAAELFGTGVDNKKIATTKDFIYVLLEKVMRILYILMPVFRRDNLRQSA